ncbi:LacI family DNA-binding transcriptional regulator [Rhizomonospora bruguierae]|uniref:LacI family DNA-binding transcriptional regulator n=1 Tax=Rhizomonospora bruguierae TaxID=1581705 RepID=UPI001BCD6016|nr:substrate-binding domain-containing protein [Micromonospora sp. NBRC 107566]
MKRSAAGKAKGPSLKTVALAAGVSLTTVSNAYNKPEHVSDEVRDMIFAIAREQGYAGPDPAARSLRSRHSGAIGVLFTSQLSYAFSDPYCVELLTGLAEVAEENRISVVLIPLARRVVAPEEEVRRSVEAVRHAVIDGAVADGIDDGHPALQVLLSRGLPLIRSVDNSESHCVMIDEREAGRSVGEYLAGLGHRHVAVVVDHLHEPSSPDEAVEEDELFPYSRLRLAGIREGLAGHGRVTVVAARRNTAASGWVAADAALERADPPTAIVATSDVLALGALEALARRNVPAGAGGVSVVGFDDIPAAAPAGLTTVRQPIREKGRLMGRMLLDSSYTQRRMVLPTQLVTRTSTGPAN